MRFVRALVVLLGAVGVIGLAVAPSLLGPPYNLFVVVVAVVYFVPFLLYYWLTRTGIGSILVGTGLLVPTAMLLLEGHKSYSATAGFLGLLYPFWTFSVSIVGGVIDRVAYRHQVDGSKPPAPT